MCALHHPIQLHVKIGLSPAVRVGVLLVRVSFKNKVTEWCEVKQRRNNFIVNANLGEITSVKDECFQ